MDEEQQEPPDLSQTQMEFTQPLPYDSMPKTIRREERQYFVPNNSNQNNMAGSGYNTVETYYSGSDIPAQPSNSWPTWPQPDHTQTLPGFTQTEDQFRSSSQTEDQFRSSSQTSTLDPSIGTLPLHHQQSSPGVYPATTQTVQPHTWTGGYSATPQYYSNNTYYYGNGTTGNYGGANANVYNQSNGRYYQQPTYSQPAITPTYNQRYTPRTTSYYRPRGRPPGRGLSHLYSHLHHSNSAPPTASNSINGMANPSSRGLLLPELLEQDDSQDEFTFAYPHIFEQNHEPFEYTIESSSRPETLQEAISMYIDYIIAENEHITRMSHSLPSDIQSPIVDEPYYQAVVGKSIPFPTEKFLKWLKLFNLDIEITDLEGNTTPQTVFEPSEPLPAQMPPSKSQPTHVVNWQTPCLPGQPGEGEENSAVHSLMTSESATKHTDGLPTSTFGINKEGRKGQVFETSAGTKFIVCEVEPDSTSQGNVDGSPSASGLEGSNDMSCRGSQPVDDTLSQSILGLSNPGVTDPAVNISQPQSTPADPCHQPSETLGEGGSIVDSLMGKSAKDIYKNSPACRTMMSLCELVDGDQVGVKRPGPRLQGPESKLAKLDLYTETSDNGPREPSLQGDMVREQDIQNNYIRVVSAVSEENINSDMHPDIEDPSQSIISDRHHDTVDPSQSIISDGHPDTVDPNQSIVSDMHPDTIDPSRGIIPDGHPDIIDPSQSIISGGHPDIDPSQSVISDRSDLIHSSQNTEHPDSAEDTKLGEQECDEQDEHLEKRVLRRRPQKDARLRPHSQQCSAPVSSRKTRSSTRV